MVPWDGSATVEVARGPYTGVRPRRAPTPASATDSVDGVAVFETKVHVPGGDAVGHVWSVADHGGLTVVDVANESPLPDRRGVHPGQTCTPDDQADRRADPGHRFPRPGCVVPLGHRASVTVALAQPAPRAASSPTGRRARRRWREDRRAQVNAASRLELGDAVGGGRGPAGRRCGLRAVRNPPDAGDGARCSS